MRAVTYGEVLKLYLDERGMTAGDLARKIGINRGSVYSLMDGRAKEPTLTRAKEIADALGVTLQEMWDRMQES